jgi:hypothetical protein
MNKDIDPLLQLIELVHGTDTYQDRLRSTNTSEFTLDSIFIKEEKEFVRDTTLDPK